MEVAAVAQKLSQEHSRTSQHQGWWWNHAMLIQAYWKPFSEEEPLLLMTWKTG